LRNFRPPQAFILGGIARRRSGFFEGVAAMLGWALTFLIIAIIAAVFGFGGIAAASVSIAKIIFFVFLILFAVSLIAGLIRRA
jgi:uncharacterized membrane protein YtjA (UPF0391 family)